MQLDIIRQRILESFDRYLASVLSAVPSIASGLVVLLLGYLLARVLRWSVVRILRTAGVETLTQRNGLDRTLHAFGGVVGLVGKVVFYLILFFFILAAAEVMEMALVSDGLRRMFDYAPRLLTALAVLLSGIWLAQRIRGILDGFSGPLGLSGGRIIGRLVFGLIVLFMGVTALNVAGVDTSLITSNILVLTAGVLVSFGVAYGFASREILSNILASFYGKDRYHAGMRVRIGADEGVIQRIDSIAISLRTDDGRTIILPAARLVTERIEVLHDPFNDDVDPEAMNQQRN